MTKPLEVWVVDDDASIRWVLDANQELEDLVLTGTADINGFGNGLANRLTGNSGANQLDGLDVLAPREPLRGGGSTGVDHLPVGVHRHRQQAAVAGGGV